MELAPGHTIADRYRIEERLGSGAMGIVYRARHVKLARAFAIKVLHAPLTANPKLRKRFQREAETASALRHRNVVGVVDIGETDNVVYLVMELAEGSPLSALMHEAPMPAARVIEYVRQLCEGLQHAHDAGLIHRDFKPENVIVERDLAGVATLRIIDFGIAVLRGAGGDELDRERLTTEGIVLGTPHYMAPEHASGEHVDHRIDLFALGVICFEMLTGRMPFDGDGVDVARANLNYDPPAMGARVPGLDVDPLLEAFTRKLMARDREQRFASAKAARAVLELIASDRDAAAIALGLAPRPVRESIPPPSTAARNMLAMPAMARARPVPNTLEPGVMATLPASEPHQRPQLQRRRAWVAAGVTALMLSALVAVAMTRVGEPQQIGELSEPTAPVTSPRSDPTPALEPPPPPAPAPVVVEHAAPSIPVLRPRVPARPRIATQAPRTTQETPSATPSAADVAALYGSVGRALGHLQQGKGSDATLDLWPRFRHIRINDAIATADSRTEAQRALEQLRRDVDARR